MNSLYDCQICGKSSPDSKKNDFCSDNCRRMYRRKESPRTINIPRLFHCSTIDNYIGDIHPIDSWLESEAHFLLIASSIVGNGKTHLAVGLLRRLWIETLKTGHFQNISSLFDELQRDIKNNESNGDKLKFKCIDSAIVVLDDIGVEKSSEYSKNVIYDIVNSRYEDKKITIFTSNLGKDDFHKRYGDRVASRIFSGFNIISNEPERRSQKAQFIIQGRV